MDNTEYAVDFAFKMQEIMAENILKTHEDAMLEVLKEFYPLVDREKCTNDTFAFVDGTSCTWVGNGWKLN